MVATTSALTSAFFKPNQAEAQVYPSFIATNNIAHGVCVFLGERRAATTLGPPIQAFPAPVPKPGNTEAPANIASLPSASSMRNTAFHFAMRSERANEPTLS